MESLRFWVSFARQTLARERGATVGALLGATLLLWILGATGAALWQLQAAHQAQAAPREVIVFFAPTASNAQIEAVRNTFQTPDFSARETRFLAASEVLDRVKTELGANDGSWTQFGENTLGAELVLRAQSVESAREIKQKIANLAGVERVESAGDAVLASQIARLQRGFWLAFGVLLPLCCLGLTALCGAVVGVGVLARRDELRAMNWSGATLGSLRAPHLMQGAALGSFGALVASALLWASQSALEMFTPTFFGPLLPIPSWKVAVVGALCLASVASLCGAIGAWLSFGRRRAAWDAPL